MHIYGLKNCDTCRKASKALLAAQFVDIRLDCLPDDILDAALMQFGDKLVNTRSTTWRGLNDQQRSVPPRDLLKAYPALMKRPLIVDGDIMMLGWTADVQKALGIT